MPFHRRGHGAGIHHVLAQVVAAIDAGVAIIHVNTEIRVAYRKALMRSLEENRDEVAPYKIMKPSVLAMQAVITEKLKIFNKIV